MPKALEPTQARSKETLRKILAACDELLQQQAFDQISMQAIAKKAGVSVGNLYNRFSDREALIDTVIQSKQQEALDYIAENLANQKTDLPLKKRISILTDALDTSTRDLRPLFISIATRQISQVSNLPEATRGNVQGMIELFANWLMLSSEEIQGKDKKKRCEFVAGSLAFSLQFDVIFGTPSRLYGKDFKRQQIEMAYAYLSQ